MSCKVGIPYLVPPVGLEPTPSIRARGGLAYRTRVCAPSCSFARVERAWVAWSDVNPSMIIFAPYVRQKLSLLGWYIVPNSSKVISVSIWFFSCLVGACAPCLWDNSLTLNGSMSSPNRVSYITPLPSALPFHCVDMSTFEEGVSSWTFNNFPAFDSSILKD